MVSSPYEQNILELDVKQHKQLKVGYVVSIYNNTETFKVLNPFAWSK